MGKMGVKGSQEEELKSSRGSTTKPLLQKPRAEFQKEGRFLVSYCCNNKLPQTSTTVASTT